MCIRDRLHAASFRKRLKCRGREPALLQGINRNAQNGFRIAQADGVEDVQFIGVSHDIAESARSVGHIIGQTVITMRGNGSMDQVVFLGTFDEIAHTHFAGTQPSKKGNARIAARRGNRIGFGSPLERRRAGKLAEQHFCTQLCVVGLSLIHI